MIRLGQLAAALASAGRQAMPAGAVLASLELSVAVAEPPVLVPGRLWRLALARPAPRWRRWLSRLLPADPAATWPWVKLTWREGRIYASLVPPPQPSQTFI